jgi:ATP-binding cassette subfamily B protein
MWGEVGVAEEDMLDAKEASRVLRRAFRMLGPYRRKVVRSAVLLMGAVGSMVASPLIIRYAIDRGLTERDAGALNLAIGLFVAAAVIGYVSYRLVILASARSARPSCGTCATGCSPT